MLPFFPHTDKTTLYTYTIYKLEKSLFAYVMKRHLLTRKDNEPRLDHQFHFPFNDINNIHDHMIAQGFVAFSPHPTDAPNIVITYR